MKYGTFVGLKLTLDDVREVAHEIDTQDGLSTDNPFFCVQRKRRDWGFDSGYEEGWAWIDEEGNEADDDLVKAMNTAADTFADEFTDAEGHGWRKLGYRDRWDTVQVCLTRRGAENYVRLNGHNLGENRIWVDSAYRNYELQGLRELPKFTLGLADEVERLKALINSPELHSFSDGVTKEAVHQRERWGTEHDAGKSHMDWFWLIGYLGGKALAAALSGDLDKAKHHTISTAAACANWHAAITGTDTSMRPGIDPPAGES